MRDTFLKRIDLILKMLNDIPGIKTNTPSGAFYVFPDVSYYFGKSDGNDHKLIFDFCMYLLHDSYVALVAGEAFGFPIAQNSYAASDEQIIDAMQRIKKSLTKLT